MGVEPFLVSSSVNAIMAQRLVRKICPHCQESYVPSETYLERVGLPPEFIGQELFQGAGCTHCLHTGYKGRIGIYELMSLTPEMKSLILSTSDAGQIKEQALASAEVGMKTLRQDGLQKVLAGLTTLEEVFRVT
jgi:general secretion pathway protein E